MTGGLSFAGGPWNNYVTHAIATMADRLPDGHTLVAENKRVREFDQADGLLLAFLVEAKGERSSGIANMFETHRLRAVQVP